MRREIIFGDPATEEVAEVNLRFFARSLQAAQDFGDALRLAQSHIHDQPRSYAVSTRFGDLDIRRARIGRTAYFLFYVVYPSVDFNTGEALDVIAFLACRHERQNEPNWQARDPFQVP